MPSVSGGSTTPVLHDGNIKVSPAIAIPCQLSGTFRRKPTCFLRPDTASSPAIVRPSEREDEDPSPGQVRRRECRTNHGRTSLCTKLYELP